MARVRGWLSPLNLHWAGIGLLALVNLYLVAQMAFLWQAASGHNAAAMAQQQTVLRLAEVEAQPLRGLDDKLAAATAESDRFYRERLPGSDSAIVNELGLLTKAQRVRLIRVAYIPAPVLPGSAGALTEVRMDAGLSGDYRPLMEFINTLERDKMFFVIDGVTLTGQQSGTVNLRLRLTTYLRGGALAAASGTAAVAGGGQTP